MKTAKITLSLIGTELAIVFILLASCTPVAGQAPTKFETASIEKNDTLIMPHSKAQQLQAILSYAYQWLPKSDAPAKDVNQILPVIQDIFNILWPAKKPEPVKPDIKKKGKDK